MGYNITITEKDFVIKQENAEAVLKALKEFAAVNSRLSYVDSSILEEADTLEEAFDEIRYPLELNEDGDYIIDYFGGENLGDDEEIFNAIAKYVEEGSYIQFTGEDGAVFRYVFADGKCTCKYPKMGW